MSLSDEEFKKLIRKQYNYIRKIAKGKRQANPHILCFSLK